MTKNNLIYQKIGINTNQPILSNKEIEEITNQLSSENLSTNDELVDLNNFVNNFIFEYHNKFANVLEKAKQISFKEGLMQGKSKRFIK